VRRILDAEAQRLLAERKLWPRPGDRTSFCLERVEKHQPIALASGLDTLGLLARGNRVVAESGNANDTDRTTDGGSQ
jgi:hypothetical protein